MSSGVELAYQQAAKMMRGDAITRVLVLSDGDANVGNTSHEEILKTIAGHVDTVKKAYTVLKDLREKGAKDASANFLKGELDEVVIVSNRFRSAISQEAAVLPLLPVTPEGEADEVGGEMIYEPDQTALLQYVVPRYIEVQIRQAILESIAGEHAARMNAMNNATDNASEMIGSLTLQMNRARQAAITTELMEIIGGAEALK